MKKYNLAIIGLGVGEKVLKSLKNHKRIKKIKIFDLNKNKSQSCKKKYSVEIYSRESEIYNDKDIDIVYIASYDNYHFAQCKKALESNKHIFVEKPLTSNSNEAQIIHELASKNKIVGQVGFVERYNQAFISCNRFIKNPKFIESHRLSDFNPRGTDVSVIMDLMIHDIDIVLKVVNSKVKKINASGVSIISTTPDIANARIEFENGCIANLTSSRISLKKMRKTRIFQEDAYISINFLEKDYQVVRIRGKEPNDSDSSIVIKNNVGEEKVIFFETSEIVEINSIESELIDFFESINNNSESKVPLRDGLLALEVAEEIMSQL